MSRPSSCPKSSSTSDSRPPKSTKLIPKELSWLSFNERVLQESENPRHPLLERVKFLGIFSNNLDEFYRVRVAELMRNRTRMGRFAQKCRRQGQRPHQRGTDLRVASSRTLQ